MANLNRVIIAGRLTRDPEVRYLPSGMAVGEFSVAISENYKNKSGEMVESTVFVEVVVWARQAETCGEYLRKGSAVLVDGRLQLDQWKSKEGESRSKLRVRADRVQFLDRPKAGAGGGEREAGGYSRPSGGQEPDEGPPVQDEPSRESAGDDDNLPF